MQKKTTLRPQVLQILQQAASKLAHTAYFILLPSSF
jgi:hypothetical protein